MYGRFFFVLSQVARLSINIGFLDRPLMAALLMGLATDTLGEALALGLVLELFWIDGLRLGTVVPPSATLSFLLLYPLCMLFGWQSPEQLPLPLLICILFAHVSAWQESWLRKRNASHDTAVEAWIEQPTSAPSAKALSPEAYIWRSHWRVLWSSALLYGLCFGLLYFFFAFLVQKQAFPIIPHLTWNILYGVGLLGAVLALRTRRAYWALGGSIVLVLLSLVLGWRI